MAWSKFSPLHIETLHKSEPPVSVHLIASRCLAHPSGTVLHPGGWFQLMVFEVILTPWTQDLCCPSVMSLNHIITVYAIWMWKIDNARCVQDTWRQELYKCNAVLFFFLPTEVYNSIIIQHAVYHQSHGCGNHVWWGLHCSSVSFLYSLCWNMTQEVGEWILSMKGKKCYNLLLLLQLILQQEFISSWLVWINI